MLFDSNPIYNLNFAYFLFKNLTFAVVVQRDAFSILFPGKDDIESR